jgi:hypothetical protein
VVCLKSQQVVCFLNGKPVVAFSKSQQVVYFLNGKPVVAFSKVSR